MLTLFFSTVQIIFSKLFKVTDTEMKKKVLIREVTNMSQRDLAQLLGVSGSAIAMYEKGERELPGKALAKLDKLELALSKNVPVPQEGDICVNVSHPKFYADAITKELQYQVLKYKTAINKLNEVLLNMRNAYELHQCWAKVLRDAREELIDGEDSAREKWLDHYLFQLNRRNDLVSPEKQFIMQHQINSKLALLAVAEQSLGLLSGDIRCSNP